ncbi:MAG: hypothetical protein E6600_04520 [Anaerocolumna aminovalerica]|uniref:hypothetical protein n=1 Tax=Anaerocolumna aminovalerica TaxID=1527 RepID=UPI00290F287F|nr:hypothetical protein [Anaerocolumna aminovalerica]MDU6263746.1 hypothetical protein [Anaerocolumna aminovalerica]
MIKYEVGEIVQGFINHEEGMVFDVTDEGGVLMVFFNRPTDKEIEQFKSGRNLEFRFLKLYNVIMLTAKFGSLNWMDAPYSPHLSKHLSSLEIPRDNQGISVQIFLIDASNGQIKHFRLVGLSEKFSKSLLGTILEEKMNIFDKKQYFANINHIFSVYSTNKLVSMSKDYCKIQGDN